MRKSDINSRSLPRAPAAEAPTPEGAEDPPAAADHAMSWNRSRYSHEELVQHRY